jgi:hypothetical protein
MLLTPASTRADKLAGRSVVIFGGGMGVGDVPSAAVDIYDATTGVKVQFPLNPVL